ncbi:phage late control D family protein [Treponema sp.]|uniref:phage late control D family protein n=1 Tax=Treponema sp. TaxID=166 RepID=UPI0025E529BC|nr:contractile injection system protein, VgrG/Pvc8 family [Treponema sp.]
MAGNDEKHLTPVWIVYVDGKRLDTEHEGALQRIHMDDVLNGVGACTLEFDTSAVKIAESGTFSLESEVSVHMGYKDDCEQVFSGEVTDFETQCNEYGHEQLLITCRNCLHKMQNTNKSTSFESKRLSDILKGIVDTYSLQSEIDDFGATKDYQVELRTTDFDFLMESAKKYGKTVYAYESKVYVKDEVTVADDDIILEWGKSLISFTAHERLKEQLSSCTFTGWDENNCEVISGNASIKEIPIKIGGSKSWEDNSNGAGGKWNGVFVDGGLHDNDDAKARAMGKLIESSFAYQTGVAKCEGDYRIHPGMRVTLKYVGKKFSGEYIADRVEHDLNIGGAFITQVYVKRNMTE